MTAAAKKPPARTQDQAPVRRVRAISTSHLINAAAPLSPCLERRLACATPAKVVESYRFGKAFKYEGGLRSTPDRASNPRL